MTASAACRIGSRIQSLNREVDALTETRGTAARFVGPGGRALWLYDPSRVRRKGVSAPDSDPFPEHPIHTRPHPAPRPRIPLIVLLDGEAWGSPQDLADAFDCLVADGMVRPFLAVVVDSGLTEGNGEASGVDGAVGAWVVRDLLPWVRSIAPASVSPDGVIVAGIGSGGYFALRCALEYPEAVGGVLSLSATLDQRELYAAAPGLVHRLHAYIEVDAEDEQVRDPNRRLAAALVAAGADAHYVERPAERPDDMRGVRTDEHAQTAARRGIADGIRALVGPPAPASPA